VDNGSSRESRNAVMDEVKMHPIHKTAWMQTNLGFIKGVNTGLEMLEQWGFPSPYVVFLNNDVVVTKGWLDRMIGIMEKDRTVFAVGPITSECTSWQSYLHAREVVSVFDIPDGFQQMNLEQRAAKLDYCFGNLYRMVSMLAFFCTVFRREVFIKLGFLDESFGVGLGDDDDFCYRMWQADMRCAVSLGTFVQHEHRSTFKTLYTEEQYKDMKNDRFARFREKHGVDPRVYEVRGLQ